MKYHNLTLASLIVALTLCSACGQTGDLFLPDEVPETEQTEEESS